MIDFHMAFEVRYFLFYIIVGAQSNQIIINIHNIDILSDFNTNFYALLFIYS